MIKFLKDMFTGRSGRVSSKIVLSVLAFIIAVIYGFLDKDLGIIIAFLTYSSTGLGWSSFDNKSAIQIKSNSNKTETITTNKNIDTKIDVDASKVITSVKTKKKAG